MSREKQIEEVRKDIFAAFGGYAKWEEDWQSLAEAIYNAGYRKQSEDMVSIETVKKWLYEMAINNVGCILEGDFSTACELIILRLDGLKRFAEETKGGAE